MALIENTLSIPVLKLFLVNPKYNTAKSHSTQNKCFEISFTKTAI